MFTFYDHGIYLYLYDWQVIECNGIKMLDIVYYIINMACSLKYHSLIISTYTGGNGNYCVTNIFIYQIRQNQQLNDQHNKMEKD